ncbi:hypothetical protein [Salipiger sp.]|uniref:hypothetical protein n=1 Tax=Salipiger sp. TaxID=2078585 RepID=UPI003A983553
MSDVLAELDALTFDDTPDQPQPADARSDELALVLASLDLGDVTYIPDEPVTEADLAELDVALARQECGQPVRPASLVEMCTRKSAEIKAENDRLRDQRNASRWKVKRDPAAYEAQKAAQRAAYARRIAETEGREVAAYVPVPRGASPEEYETNRKAREAEGKWLKRAEAKGWTAEQIAAGLAKRQAKRASLCARGGSVTS